ncbi:MAG TPA: glycoside hydrolase family 25 protein [Candidatus Limnocylindrales bacterium]
MPLAAGAHRTRSSQRTLLITAALAAALLFVLAAAAAPSRTFATTTTTKVALCNANLRTTAIGSYRIKKVAKTGTLVTTSTTVTGRSYSTTCAGKSVSGRTWIRISAVNGKSVKSLYGVTYVYAAAGLFKTVPISKYARCQANLRSSWKSGSTVRSTVKVDTMLTVVAIVSGRDYRADCSGTSVAGSNWARVSAVNGKSVRSLFGVSYVYVASKLLTANRTLVAPPPPPAPGTLEGLDVSHWQNTIDWFAVAASGKTFTYMKASEDTDFIDPLYDTNRAGATVAGLKVGAYHFAQPDSRPGDAIAEADHFIDTAGPQSGDLIPVLDLERSGGLSTTALTAWVRAFLERVEERLGVHGVIYCSPSFWKNYMGDSVWFANNGYEVLWVAHWTTSSDPTVPGGAWGANGWTFWQYTSSGVVPGIAGRVDLNRYNGTDLGPVRIP